MMSKKLPTDATQYTSREPCQQVYGEIQGHRGNR
jgi:hypothetical protein